MDPYASLPEHIQDLLMSLHPLRLSFARTLLTKSWFRNTDFSLQKKILTLPDDFNGFLSDLTERPDQLENIEIIRMVRLEIGVDLCLSVFDVREVDTAQVFHREFVSWKSGRFPGVKGVILIEIDGKIEYFVTKQIVKFPVAENCFDAVGGHLRYAHGRIKNLEDEFENEIKTQLNLPQLNFTHFHHLGTFQPDNGLTISSVSLFAAVLDGNSIDDIKRIEHKTLKAKNQHFKIELVPVSKLQEYLIKIEDSFTLVTLTRLIAQGIIPLEINKS